MHTISKREWRHLQAKLVSEWHWRKLPLWHKHHFHTDCHPRQLWFQPLSFTCEAFSPPLLSHAQWTAICTLTWHCRTVNFVFLHFTLRDGLMGQAASACQLRLLTSDPGRNPRLLLRMLLHRDCHLPRILLENSCKSVFSVHGLVYVKGWRVCENLLCTHTCQSFRTKF